MVRWSFDGVVLDSDRFLLERDGEPVRVEPQVFDVLAYLITHRDRVVPKIELLDEIWGDRFVSESALSSRIKSARRAVGDDGTRQAVIQTVHGRGFRFVADVDEVDLGPVAPVRGRTVEQHIRFTTAADGTRIGYATVGSGPPLVRAPHWVTHLHYDWHSPVWRHWIEGLAQHHTFVRFDQRGCGLSENDPRDISLDAFVGDLEAVVDAAGLERFPLMGLSQGGAIAVTYAARHPDRVSKLILVGAFVRGRRARARTEAELRAVELQMELVRVGWGSEDPSFRMVFPPSFIPDSPPELWSEFATLLRRTTSSRSAERIMTSLLDVDVRDAARCVCAPTLVMHARDELRIPFAEALEYASLIPGSRLVPLDSRNHLLRPDEPAWPVFLDELERFLAEP